MHRSLQAIRALGKKAGVTMNPATPVSSIEHVIDLVDLILIMSVNPGFGGQSFIPAALDKLREVRTLVGARPIDIEVDGGVTAENAANVVQAGANVLVAGSAVFKGGNYKANIAAIRNAAAHGARGSGLKRSEGIGICCPYSNSAAAQASRQWLRRCHRSLGRGWPDNMILADPSLLRTLPACVLYRAPLCTQSDCSLLDGLLILSDRRGDRHRRKCDNCRMRVAADRQPRHAARSRARARIVLKSATALCADTDLLLRPSPAARHTGFGIYWLLDVCWT